MFRTKKLWHPRWRVSVYVDDSVRLVCWGTYFSFSLLFGLLFGGKDPPKSRRLVLVYVCMCVWVCISVRVRTWENKRVLQSRPMWHDAFTCDMPNAYVISHVACRIHMGFDSCICCYTAHSWTIVCKRLTMTTCPSWTVPRVTNYVLTRDWTHAYVTQLIRKPSCAEIGNGDILYLNNTTTHDICNESPTVYSCICDLTLTNAYVAQLIREPSCTETGRGSILFLNNASNHEVCYESRTMYSYVSHAGVLACRHASGVVEHHISPYGVTSISRLLEMICLFCKRAL